MRLSLFFALLLFGIARGNEPAALTMREKLRARIVETLPPPKTTVKADEKAKSESRVLELAPMVISEKKGARELEKVLASEKQRLEAERFSLVKGGTIYKGERLELGSWWSPETGWKLVKIKW